MARPKSDNKRSAIMAAATRVIAAQGLTAATAAIAQEAGVSSGSLFTYFETKADLLNQLYVEIKTDRAVAAMEGVTDADGIRAQTMRMWSNTLRWAIAAPQKRKALAQLDVSDEVTAQSRETGHRVMSGVAKLLEQGRAHGPMRDVPLGFVVAMLKAMTDATMEFIAQDPAHAQIHETTAFEALWRMIA
jgi:AcrR family transcriptional regulator